MIRRALPIVAAATALAACAGQDATPDVRSVRQADLVLIPGGTVQIGDNTSQADERPAFIYQAKPLLMDRTPVTVAQFARFVAETGYVTEAERLGESSVFEHDTDAWAKIKGATWRRPQGPQRPAAYADHPVTQVSWNDAAAFCAAYGARLPTEFEWERAARLGQTPDGHVFGMGEPPLLSNAKVINIWQGAFPIYDSGIDGYKLTSPVGKFGTAPSGLTDMAGNVWEWTSSWYRPYGRPNWKPTKTSERVQRGGSFLCDPTLCAGFRATARAHSTPDSSLMHVGFRCVMDPKRPRPLAGHIVASARPAAPSA
ncbi:formylglycine-generating enzyme family protein [Phenylobacterium sp.]|uniref:formylglycine-generating enzyme family protein n=1 Tax=Phenylobacterium sp. TaxID=1871053 RepID=UPI0025F2948A|nr:formylglycine-generating enzyme family protein [Phenylobacterium sp.]MBX3485115.1 formylglycine-generating enzyme family protein [Phenylobacterium sp.]